MKKFFLLMTVVLAAAGFTGCSFDDSDLWDKLRDQDERLTRLEQKVEALNTDIQSIQAIVDVLQSHDMITSVTELSDGSGYVIEFVSHDPITIKNGQDGVDGTTPVIAVAEEDGIYYWTINGDLMKDSSGNNIPVTGNNGEDAIAPQLQINDTTMMWEISTDGGITWVSTNVVAQGQDGDSFFSNVNVDNPEYVIFTLSNGTIFEVPRYNVLSLTFTGLNEGIFEFLADGNENSISYTSTGTIANIGIASAVPTGWNITVDMQDNQILISSAVPGDIQALIVATSADGSSASYWINLHAISYIAPSGLQAAIDTATAGDVIELNDNVEYVGPITIDKDITLVGGTGTIISAVSPAAVATNSYQGANPVIVVSPGVVVTIENVRITTEDSPVGAQVDGLTILGDSTETIVNLNSVVFDGILATDYSGAQNGRAVTVYGEGTILNVTDCSFTRFNKNGIHVMEGTANISGSIFEGHANAFDTNDAAQNGIVFMTTALGSVANCSFSDFVYGDSSSSSTAVLLYLPSDTSNVTDGGGNSYNNCDLNWEISL